jgi:hypothetical protein
MDEKEEHVILVFGYRQAGQADARDGFDRCVIDYSSTHTHIQHEQMGKTNANG